MTDVLQYALLGLGPGAVYALLATGVVLVYRGSGVLNFAQGAVAMFTAYIFVDLTQNDGWSVGYALVFIVAFSILLGIVSYNCVIRLMAKATATGHAIATLALFMVLEGIGTLIWGPNGATSNPILPADVWHLGSLVVNLYQLLLVAVALFVSIGLWAVFRFSALGMAITATAENPRAAAALGWSPSLLGTVTWAAGGALAALGGVLIVPLSGLQVETTSLLVVPAMAGALIGGLVSFRATLIGSILLGIAQTELQNYVPQVGIADAVPLVIIVIVLALRGTGLPGRGTLENKLAMVPDTPFRARAAVVATALLLAVVWTVSSPDLTASITETFVYGIVLLSIVLLTGYTGQISLAQLSVAGLAGFTAAKLVASAHLPFEVAGLIGALSTVPLALILGLPALRARGNSLAIVTLAVATVVTDVLFDNGQYTGTSGTPVGGQTLFGINIDPVAEPRRYATVAIVTFMIIAWLLCNFRGSRAGHRLLAVRANERAAAALGVGVYGAKIFAFVVAGVVAGIGGILIAFSYDTVTYDQYDPVQSIYLMAYAVIAGVGFLSGSLFGATLVAGSIGTYVLTQFFPGIANDLSLIGGVWLLAILVLNPDGMVMANVVLVRGTYRWGRRMRTRHRDSVSKSAPADRRGETDPERRDAADAAGSGEALVARSPSPARSMAHPRAGVCELSIRNLSVRFGLVYAVRDLSLDVRAGEVVGLIGPNGAGKTTVIDAASGFVAQEHGTVSVGGADLSKWAPHKRARYGLSRSFQSLELIPDMTIGDNIELGADLADRLAYLKGFVARARRRTDQSMGADAIRGLDLEYVLDVPASDASYGHRRLAAVARALAGDPKVVLLDEPASGLSSTDSERLSRFVREIADTWQIAVLIVEHNMQFVMDVCDRVAVLSRGQLLSEGPPAQIRSDPAVIAAYLGEAPGPDDREGPRIGPPPGAVVERGGDAA